MTTSEKDTIASPERPGSDSLQPTVAPGRRSIWLVLAPALLPFLYLFITSLRGIDFGHHWDEGKLVSRVENTVHTGVLMPVNFYNYPAVSYWISTAAAVPEFKALLHADSSLSKDSLKSVRADLDQRIEAPAFHLRARALFAFVSSLALIWTYLLVLRWRNSVGLALLASCALGFSWQVAYHARWMAPDAVLMQFGALTLLCTLEMLRSEKPRFWLNAATVAAGLGFGTKYPAILLLLPVLLAAHQVWGNDLDTPERLRQLGRIVGLFLLTYLITTPGTLLEPLNFVRCVLFELNHYRRGHFGHTISPGPSHLWHEFLFFAISLFSRYPLIALSFFGLSVLGGYALYRESRQTAWVVFSFPLIYLLYMSTQHVFIVRNLLVIAPFLATLLALGVEFLWKRLPHIALRGALALALTAALGTNAAWLATASQSIAHRDPARDVRDLAAYVRAHPDKRFLLSPRLNTAVGGLPGGLPANVSANAFGKADYVALYPLEGLNNQTQPWWPCLDWNLIVTQFGPYEVDFNYYALWEGEERIIILTVPKAKSIGVALTRYTPGNEM